MSGRSFAWGEIVDEKNCLFCGIAAGAVPAKIVHDDQDALAFWDVRPVAPTHVLVIPKTHIANLAEVGPDQWSLITRTLEVVQAVAKQLGLADRGYRIVANVGNDGGQTVHHLHWHILGGRFMTWPPG